MTLAITKKAFTILELLVVLAVLGVFTAIAYPNISNWITDREVRSEAYEFVAQINQMKSKVTSGEYALARVDFDHPSRTYATIKRYYMTTTNYNQNYSGSKTHLPSCTKSQSYQSDGNYSSELTRHWPNTHICISKNGSKIGPMDLKNPETGGSKSLEAVVICSVNNSQNSGSKICNINNKLKHRYLLTWDKFVNLKVYKFNFEKNSWCDEKKCRNWSEFN